MITRTEAVNELFAALSKAQNELRSVAFDLKNPHFQNEFASLQAIQDATRPILSKHGLSISQVLNTEGDGTWLHTILGHSSGQHIISSLKLLMARNDMQSVGSANTYARRYAWQSIIGVAGDKDDDGEAAVGRVSPSQPRAITPTPKPKESTPAKRNEAPADRAQFAKIAHLLDERHISNEVFQTYLKKLHDGCTSKTMKYFQGAQIIEILERVDTTEAVLMAAVARQQ
jgi:hypothetical protein